MARNTPKANRVNAVNLTGFSSAELTALSRRCLAVRKGVNGGKRAVNARAKAAKLNARKARLVAEIARLENAAK